MVVFYKYSDVSLIHEGGKFLTNCISRGRLRTPRSYVVLLLQVLRIRPYSLFQFRNTSEIMNPFGHFLGLFELGENRKTRTFIYSLTETRTHDPMRFKVLTATSMKMIVIWDAAPCSLVEIDQHFRGSYCLHHQGDDDGDSEHL
jgi:hypothetical protein